MLTARGWWFLLTVLCLQAFAGLAPLAVARGGMGQRPGLWSRLFAELVSLHGDTTLSLLGLALLLWFAWEWFRFTAGVRLLARRLFVDRQLHDERGVVETLWAGRTFDVHVRLGLRSAWGLPYLIAGERVPFGALPVAGETRQDGAVTAARPLTLSYRLRCTAPGRIRFEGVAVQLADRQGFFYHATFVAGVQTYRVLPPLADAQGKTAAVKRHNLLPPPGVHRHRRPGSGSELLDLRDYLPGDPPKTIAWKASARRDRLITKEFESEVPVRCTLFVDTSNSVRIGPPGQNALARLVEIAAAVAQANSGARDLTGVCMFDEHDATHVRPARGPRHLARLLNLLTDAAGLAPTTGKIRSDALLSLAYAFAEETYPDRLRPELNAFPFWLPWFSPQPPYTIRRPTLADYLYAAPPRLLLLFVAGFYLSLVAVPLIAPNLLATILLIAGYNLGELLFGLGFFMLLAVAFARRRRRARYRKRLAALLSAHYGLAPGGLALLLEDDEQFALFIQRFLAEHQVPYALPLYDRDGCYLFAAPGKVDTLARALLRAVGKGHDNELFVLLADLLELEGQLDPLLRAVKVALARHHRVLLICPWPPGLPPPGSRDAADSTPGSRVTMVSDPPPIFGTLRRATTARFQRAYHTVRRTFARLGVPVVCAQSEEPAQLILQRLDQLRSMGRKR